LPYLAGYRLKREQTPADRLLVAVRLPINEIRVGHRVREDPGDLKGLAQSIESVGLLHPIVVATGGKLIAGERRLKACRLLGWDKVPVTQIDLAEILSGEQAENLARRDFTPSEIVGLKRAIEPMQRRAARLRQGTRTDMVATVATKFGKSRDHIARYLGVSRITIGRAEAVVIAAETHPRKYGWLLERMDRTGNVAHFYRQLVIDRQAEAIGNRPFRRGHSMWWLPTHRVGTIPAICHIHDDGGRDQRAARRSDRR
jgi:ParB/RepB/Spo0J family partition protein